MPPRLGRLFVTPRALPRGLVVVAAVVASGCTIMSNFPTSAPRTERAPDGTCNSMALGPPVQPTELAEQHPAPTGGVVADGIYRLTAFALYVRTPSATPAPMRAIALRVHDGLFDLASARAGESRAVATYRFAPDGTSLVLERTCGDWTPSVTGYDATPVQLRVHVALPNGVGIWTLDRVTP